MRKAIIIITTALLTFSASAQSILSGLSVGVGYINEVQSVRFIDAPEYKGMHGASGFYVGADYCFDKLLGPIDLTVGLSYQNYTANIGKMNERLLDVDLEGGKMTANFNVLDIPVRFGYSYDFGVCKVSAFAGPKADFTLGGRCRDVVKVGSSKTVHKYSMYDEAEGLGITHFQLYLGLGVAVQFLDNYRVCLSYDGGLFNRLKGDQAKLMRWSNPSQINLGVAYCF